MSGPPDLEVLVVSFNSASALAACLRSVAAAAPGTPVAIREHGTDVDAAAELARLLATHVGPIRVERDPSNPGFGAGCNALARASTASHLLFLNPDAEIVSWPWRNTPPPVGAIVGPRMISTRHPFAHTGQGYRIRDEIARSWLRRSGPPPDGTGFVSGAALLVDRATFDRVGGFDERYFMFYEDIDLCARANAIGARTIVETEWAVRHEGAHSTRSRFGRSLMWSYESALRFHGDRDRPLRAYRAYVLIDALLRAALRVGRRDRAGATAYGALARRAGLELVSGRSRPTRP